MKLPQRLSLYAGFGAILVLGVFAWAPATYPGYWQALEGFVPVFNLLQPSKLAAIATTPDLWRGVGSAAFLLSRPFLVAGLNPTAALRITFICCFLLGGLGTYAWLQTRVGDRGAGLAGLAYMLAPPLLATVYVRGSVSDAMVLALLPIALAGLTIYREGNHFSAATVAVIAIWWIWQTQAGLALLCTLLLLLYAGLVERHGMTLLIVALSGGAGLTSLLPLFSYQMPAPVNFFDHFVALFQLFRPGWQVMPSTPGWQDGYPFQLGFVVPLMALLTLWFWRYRTVRHTPAVKRMLWFGVIGLGVIIWLSLASSQWFWMASGASRLLTYPWQVLLFTVPLLAMMVGILPTLHPTLRQSPYWVVLLILIVLGSLPYLSTEFTQYQPPTSPLAVLGNNEIVVLTANLSENRQLHQAELAVTWQPIQPLPFDYNVFFQVLSGQDQTLVLANQIDVPPLDGGHPATSWRPGEILTETYQIDLTGIAPNAQLQYYFGYYDWRNGARLSVNGGIDDKLIFYGK
ncbi:MAG: hypothetical protein R3C14_16875 [Caldilineaceae bacterium]